MDDAEIDRLRKAICRSFNSQPHKKKYWLAVLAMHTAPKGKAMPGRRGSKDLHAAGGRSVDAVQKSFVQNPRRCQ
jgi:hypothetical protein